jgi:ankyrin repeat protein
MNLFIRFICMLSWTLLVTAKMPSSMHKKVDHLENLHFELINAIQLDDVETVKLLLPQIPVNAIIAREDATPLMYAVNRGRICIECNKDEASQSRRMSKPNKAIVEAILDAGADLGAKTSNGATALHFAAQGGSGEIIQLLLDRGGKKYLESRDEFKSTPLLWAEENLDTLATLVNAGANINVQDNNGNTLLNKVIKDLSFQYNFVQGDNFNQQRWDELRTTIKNCVKFMLNHHADPNIRNKDGISPLMYATYYMHPEMVELLLKAGVKADIKNNKGKTSLQLAQERLERERPSVSDKRVEQVEKQHLHEIIKMLSPQSVVKSNSKN